MKLYYFETMNCRKACGVAKYLALPVQLVLLDASVGEHKQPAHLARNPNGLVPVLEDGERTIWESNAIMVHLASRAGSALWPSEAARQVEVIRWLSWNAYHFEPVTGTYYFEHLIKPQLGMGETDREALRAQEPAFFERARLLDDHLAKNRYAAGDALTVADFALGAALAYAAQIELPLAPFPHLQRWNESLLALPAWRNPWAG